ncbi:uncharacterized protein LOC129762255 isoform X2 [Toxorhynchites rutilus septentrionalis]|uniref:uncharacterized protein LOC129762255 isoform X2 n=1 Tax=Toxorhynchites rutilus septentrionalis TaxID=329112 RepID=UPI00247A1F46|nr:uncharacterized protein LOC129762255 isoform X2 [Toxorhynchites rutilus septentrionalis]
MRPNVVYDHYRWKKKIDQAMERSADGNNAGGGNKIPVLTGGAATGTSGTTTAAASNSPPRSAGGIMTTPTRRPNKRKSSSGSPAARKRRKLQQAQLKAGGDPSAEQAPQTKNTVAVLNELKRNLVYNLESQTGPVHAPLFTMSVVVDGQKFIGHGRSKKLARIEAAAAALRSFIQFKDGATLTPIKPLQNVDFTSDDPMIENSIFPMSDTPALPEAIVTSPSMITANKSGSKGASEKAYIPRSLDSKERHNGPNHNNNNNNTNNNIINNNVHSTNNSNSPYQSKPNSIFSNHNNTITSYNHQTAASHNSYTSNTSFNKNNNHISSHTFSGYPLSNPGPSTNTLHQAHYNKFQPPVHNQHQYYHSHYTNHQQQQLQKPQHHTHNQVVVQHQQSLAQSNHHSKIGSSVNAFAAAIAAVASNSNSSNTTITTNHSSNIANSNNNYTTNTTNNTNRNRKPRTDNDINTESFNALPTTTTTLTPIPTHLPPQPLTQHLSPLPQSPVLAAAAAAATTTSSQKSSIATSLNNNNNKNSNIKNSRNTLNNNSSNNNPTNSGGSAATAATTTTSSTAPAAAAINIASNAAHNDHRQVVAKIQQSLDLFKNTNEKNVAWKKRLEITQQLCSKSTISGKQLKASAANASRNVSPGQPPKPQPEKGPVMLLHELFTDAHFECVSTEGLQHSKFTVVVTVDSQRFEGTGPSKKMAKNAAAKAALASMCNISFSPLQQAKFGALNSNSSGGGGGMGGAGSGLGVNGDATGCYDPKNVELPQTFADSIGKLVIEKFNEVMKGNDVYSRRKVLAGIVMTQAYDVRTAKVISLATGTKCVSGEHMSVTGTVINDSHAEIIARRGLLDYFYAQLDLHCRSQSSNTNVAASNNNSATAQYNGKGGNNNNTNSLGGIEQPEQESSIFVRPADGSTLYRLKDGINFHLYINTAPCGDARVFSPHENDNMDVDKHPNRKARGQLRTKVESGEGTIPVKSSEGIQTWDGVLQGQRLLTMSCSDKISRWNVLGLQGSLLASVIEPIYLHSIVLGSLLHPAHMYRAICGRVENSIQGLPPPYRLNKPKLALMTSAESRNQTKPPNFSINWVIGCSEVEIVNSFTGKLINNNTNTNKMSRLSKQSFYRRFAAAIERLPHARFREVKPTYFETKMCVPEYQQAKKELFAAFSKEDLGDWLKKPIEQDQFTLIPPKPEELMSASSGNTGSSNSSSSSNNGTGSNANGTTSGTK